MVVTIVSLDKVINDSLEKNEEKTLQEKEYNTNIITSPNDLVIEKLSFGNPNYRNIVLVNKV
jgi:hypothetical protein